MPVLTKEQIIEAVFELPPDEREQLRERLIQNDDGFHLTEEQKEEIRAEIRAYDANPEDVVTWDEVKAKVRSQAAA